MTIQIDAIVPAFNAERFIAATIGSILEQDEIREIIVVDDGSTDNTLNTARTYGDPVVVLSGPNRGVSSARNKGILQLDSDWVQFVDSDDVLTPSTLSKRLEVARETQADVIVTDWAEFSSDDQAQASAESIRVADWERMVSDGAEVACATSFWAPPAAILYNRRIVKKVGGFREDFRVVEDARFLFDAARCGARFAHAPHVGALYRNTPNSLSKQNRARFWLSVLKNGKEIETLWQSDGEHSDSRRLAINEMYKACANALVREGHPMAFEANRLYMDRGGSPDAKLRLGLWILGAFGQRVVRASFKAGQARPKRAASERKELS